VGKEAVCKHTHILFAVHICAEIDLEVLGVVDHIQEAAALVTFGDAECVKQNQQPYFTFTALIQCSTCVKIHNIFEAPADHCRTHTEVTRVTGSRHHYLTPRTDAALKFHSWMPVFWDRERGTDQHRSIHHNANTSQV